MKNTNCMQKWQLMLWSKTDKWKISAPVWMCACSVQVPCLFYSCYSVFHKGGVWIRPSSIVVTNSELPSVTHTWGVEGKCSTGFGLNGAYMCSLNQQVSGFTINPFFIYLYTCSQVHFYLPEFQKCVIWRPFHWVKVSLYKFITVLHLLYSTEYLTCQVNFSVDNVMTVGSKLKMLILVMYPLIWKKKKKKRLRNVIHLMVRRKWWLKCLICCSIQTLIGRFKVTELRPAEIF